MKYRKLGSTGLTVSEIGFGAWGIGGNANGSVAYGPTDAKESKQALRCAFDAGITFYDTSDFYGMGHSEHLIGEALADVRKDIIIATKVGLLDTNGTQDFSQQHVRSSVEKSLRRLHTDYIDLYQLHSPSMDMLAGDKGILDVFQELKAEGKIRAFGISVRGPNDGFQAINELGVGCIQVNFNMIDQRALQNGLFALCEEKGVGLIARTPLCFGFLTGRYSGSNAFDSFDHRSKWDPEQIERWARAFNLFADIMIGEKAQTPTHIALRYCLSFPPVSTTIPGMLTCQHVEENALASAFGALSCFELEKILEIYNNHSFFVAAKPNKV